MSRIKEEELLRTLVTQSSRVKRNEGEEII